MYYRKKCTQPINSDGVIQPRLLRKFTLKSLGFGSNHMLTTVVYTLLLDYDLTLVVHLKLPTVFM